MTWFIVCSVVAALALARDFLLPIALAIFLAFILAPLVRRLVRAGVPRAVATMITMASSSILVIGIGWLLVAQLRSFTDNLPDYRENMRAKAADIRSTLGDRVEEAKTTIRAIGDDLSNPTGNSSDATPPAPEPAPESGIGGKLQDALGSVLGTSMIAAFVFLLATVMLFCWEDLRDRLLALAGMSDLAVTTRAGQEASAKISLYLRRQLLVNSMHGTAVGILLWCIGVPNPLVWGFLAGVLRFVPYLGPIAGTVAPILVSFASSDGWTQMWITASALLVLEIVTNNIVEPLLYGASTGVSPLALLISAALWTWIWGPAGLVLSTPLTVCLMVVGKYVPSMHFLDILFGDEPVMSKGARLYHRLLANDSDESWEIVRAEAARTSTLAAVDDVLMPALGLVASTRGDGRVDRPGLEVIGSIAHGIVDELADLQQEVAAATAGGIPRVLCIGARDAFDSVGARVFALECKRRGIEVTYAGPERSLAEVSDSMRSGEVDLVVVSSVLPAHFLHIRSFCKRLLAVESRAEILIGLWGKTMSSTELLQRLPTSPRLQVTTSLAGAVAWTETAAPRFIAQRSSQAVSA